MSLGPTPRARRLLIVGAGGHGRVVADTAALTRAFQEIAFVERGPAGPAEIDGFPCVYGEPTGGRFAPHEWDFIVGIGDNRRREAVQGRMVESGYRAVSLVHPTAYVSPRARLGAGSVVFAACVVQTGVMIGDGVIINNRASVDHDCVLGSFAHLAPGAVLAGDVRIGPRSMIGVGASIRHGKVVGEDVMVGAGAAVVSDLAAGGIYVGVPARLLRPPSTLKGASDKPSSNAPGLE